MLHIMAEPENKPLESKRDEDFASLYANNVQMEVSAWDLKFTFGQLDQAQGFVKQHTAITVSWQQAKIMAYFLVANVFVQQAAIPIILRNDIVPPRPNPNDAAWAGTNMANVAYLGWIHDQFFGTSPYIPPAVAEETKGQSESEPAN